MKTEEQEKKKDSRRLFMPGDFLILGLVLLYAFVMVYTGLCLDASSTFVNPKNTLALMARGLGLVAVDAGTGGMVGLCLIAVYLPLLTAAWIFEYRLLKRNNKNPWGKEGWITYAVTFALAVLLSWGLAYLIQMPYSGSNGAKLSLFLGECIAVSLLVYLFFALFVGALVLLLVGIVKLFRPATPSALSSTKEEKDENDVTKDLLPKKKEETVSTPSSVVTTNLPAKEPLSPREKVFPGLSRIDARYSGIAQEKEKNDDLSLAELAETFRNYLAVREKLYYEPKEIRAYLAGMGVSHLSLLQGLSGTGKSSLPRAFASFTGNQVVFLPVQATWRDKSAILGYFNDFSGTYHETEGLLSLYESSYRPDRIYVFVLDEMNISRVEYYFADFLSVLEYPSRDWRLSVLDLPYGFIPPVRLTGGVLSFGPNVYFVGTANTDESTFAISDKVYDRSVVLSFEKRRSPFTVNGKSDPVSLSSSGLQALFHKAWEDPSLAFSLEDEQRLDAVSASLEENFSVSFGNRSYQQLSKFVPLYQACGGSKEEAVDLFLREKVLPKLSSTLGEPSDARIVETENRMEEVYGKEALKESMKFLEKIRKSL